jgi:hypothetical protein
MQFISRADIEAPIAFVFGQVSDFPAFERQLLRRGAEVRRVDRLAAPGKGAAWDVRFRFRGRDREVHAEVVAFDPPNGLTAEAESANIHAVGRVELIALSPQRTRLCVRLDLSAHTLPARLLLQSLRLAKANLNARFDKRVTEFAAEVQARYQRRAAGA